MPRNRRMMDYLMKRARRDGRNPYGSEGGYVVSRRRGRDGLMMEDMARYNRGESDMELSDMTRQNQEIMHDPYMPRDYAQGGRGGQRARDYGSGITYAGVDDFYEQNDMTRGRREQDYARGGNRRERADYGYDMARGRRDGHYPMGMGEMYYPIEAMGYFNGYYGMGEKDFARGRREMDYARGGRGRGRNSRAGGRDYGMDYPDYGYDYADYGYDYGMMELEDEDLEEWAEKLKKELEEKDKQFFSKENIKKKAEEMGIKFEKFTMPEFYVTVLMMYTDYCKTLGTANMDIYLRLAKDWLEDKDVSVKGGEKLAAYYENIVDAD